MNQEAKPIAIRTHHLMCLINSAAQKSTRPEIIATITTLRAHPDGLIRLVIGPDDVCLPCPDRDALTHTCGKGCEDMNKIKDARYLDILDLAEGDVLPARQLYALVADRITLDHMKAVCPDCRPERCALAAKDALTHIFGSTD